VWGYNNLSSLAVSYATDSNYKSLQKIRDSRLNMEAHVVNVVRCFFTNYGN